MSLNEILKFVVPTVCATFLGTLMFPRLLGALPRRGEVLQLWTACGAGAAMGSFAGALLLASIPLLDQFPLDYLISIAVALGFALALAQVALHKNKERADESPPEQ